MRIIYMGNNWVGWQILEWLVKEKEEIIGLVVHPDERAKYRKEILECVSLPSKCIWDGPMLREKKTLEGIRNLKPDLILSILFIYILKPELLTIPQKGAINLHNGYLPYNAGVYANVWSIVDETPSGATLHYMDEGVDTGDIIAQREILVKFEDTGESLYHKTEQVCVDLFKDTWPQIKHNSIKRIPQKRSGTYHSPNDVRKIDKIDLHSKYKAKDLINILRARTFPPYESAYVEVEGKKYYLRISIEEAEK